CRSCAASDWLDCKGWIVKLSTGTGVSFAPGGMNVPTNRVSLIVVLLLTCVRAGAQTPQPGQPQLTPAQAKQEAADWAAADMRIITPGVVNASGLPDLAAAYTKSTGKKVAIRVIGMGTIVEEINK